MILLVMVGLEIILLDKDFFICRGPFASRVVEVSLHFWLLQFFCS